MALKPDRYEDATDLSFFMHTTAERGIVVVHDSSASGVSMDNAEATVAIPTSGVAGTLPAGILLNDVVNVDLTRTHLNEHQDEVQVNNKVLLLRRGWVVTNQVTGAPLAGQDAYYDTTGGFTLTTTSPKVGRFLSGVDDDGYCKVEVNIT